jgi:uncharacterized repeat protein (TIGR01451 family)
MFTRARRLGASLLVIGLLGSLIVGVASPAGAATPLGEFEIDGNQGLDDPELIDWETVKTDTRISEFALFGDDGESYLASSKEQDPTSWECAANEAPPKDNILRLYLASQISASEQLLHIGYVRTSGTGDTDIDIEFNRVSGEFSCPGGDGRTRTEDDLLISFVFPGGSNHADIDVFRWDPTAAADADGDFIPEDGHWEFETTQGVAGGDNAESISDLFYDNTPPETMLAARTFSELTVDLGLLFDEGLLDCPGLGFVTPHSRASHSFESDLKDVLPEATFNLSDCGSLKLKKVDDLGRPMSGVTFGLYENDNGAKGNPVTLLGQNLTCVTNAQGICFFPRVPPGSYLLDEVATPAGYTKDPRLPFPVTIGTFEDVDLSDDPDDECEVALDEDCEWFVNSRKTGSVTVTKYLADAAGNRVDLTAGNLASYSAFILGAQFDLQQGDPLVTAKKADGTPASCTITAGDIDLASDSASCEIDKVLYGAYVVHETPPPGTEPVLQDQAVTVGDNQVKVSMSFTNVINPDTVILKTTSTPVVDAGDAVSFALKVSNRGDAPALGVVLTDNLNADITGWVSDPGNPPCSIAANVLTCAVGTLDPGEDFEVTLTGTSTPAACPSITNQASVSSTNETTEDAADNNSEVVTVAVRCPDVHVAKSTSTATVSAGDEVRFSITVNNSGPGVAKDVSFLDDLPNGVTWSFDGSAPAGCSLNGSNNLACTFPTLDSGASVTVNLKGTADAADCPSITNPSFTVSASNETAAAAADNSTSPVVITVNCPAIEVEKAGNGPINAGEDAAYTITVTNAGPGVATGVVVTDTLPAGVAWTEGDPFPAECDITGGNSLACTFPSLPAASVTVIEVVGTTDSADCPSITNLLVSADPSNGDPDSAGPVEIVVNCPDMSVIKAGNGPISAGDPDNPARYTITVTNAGPGVATEVTFDDILPAGLVWTAGTPFPQECSIGDDDRTLSCAWESFALGSVVIAVEAATDPEDCPSITNPISAVLAGNESQRTVGNNSTAEVEIVINCPDLELEKVADETSVSRGDPISFSITVWNQGDGTAFDASVSDPLPDGFDWDFDGEGSDLPEGAGCSVNDATNTLSCDLGDLAGGSSEEEPAAVIHVVAADTLPAGCGPYQNTASVSAANDDGDSDSASVTLLCPGINIVKTADDDLVEAGGAIGFTLEVTNTGPGEAKAVVVTDDLPGNLDWTVDTAGSSLPEGATCDIAGGVLTCLLGYLPATEAAPQVSIHVVADTDVPAGNGGIGDCGNYPNAASATPVNGEGDTSATVDVDVRCPLDIALTKTGPALAHVGDTVTYDFTVTNTGFVDLVNVNLVDPICDAGTLVLVTRGDGDAILEIDQSADVGLQREVWTYRCTRVVRATDPDPLPNTATVTGTDADNRTTVDTASWVVDLIHPAISIVKTANPVFVTDSGPVTYTYVITNTGDTTLSNILVVDDILGAIGTVGSLAPGESLTMAKTVVVDFNTPPVNIGTVTAKDVLGQTVTARDDAVITVVLGEVLVLPELPRTGGPLGTQARLGFLLVQVGLVLHLLARRRRVGAGAG